MMGSVVLLEKLSKWVAVRSMAKYGSRSLGLMGLMPHHLALLEKLLKI
jgi:hypothetical protein